jgi:Domain of unknown function (DUF4263)
MKEFLHVDFDPMKCRLELAEFRTLLASKQDLEEATDIKPFFESHLQLASFVGCYGPDITHYELLAFQYQLFGDYSCDMVVGDPGNKSYGFIEWEDATDGSLFRQQGRKATPEWATRFEHAFSQLVDWYGKLDDMARTDEFEVRFGARNIRYFGLLIAGRDAHLAHPRERRRWEWRGQKVLVDSLPVWCVTYDQLWQFLSGKLNVSFPSSGLVPG